MTRHNEITDPVKYDYNEQRLKLVHSWFLKILYAKETESLCKYILKFEQTWRKEVH